MRKFAWSHSALTNFENCARKYQGERITKEAVHITSDAADYGLDVHKKFELFVSKNKPLPLDMKHHAPFLEKLRKLGEPLAEQRLALNKQLHPTGYFDHDTWFRAVLDFAGIIDDRIGVVIDYKTGRHSTDTEQLRLQAATLLAFVPTLEIVEGRYYWTKSKTCDSYRWRPAELTAIWAEFMPRVAAMEQAIATGSYPATKGYLCAKYCGVRACEHNGKRA